MLLVKDELLDGVLQSLVQQVDGPLAAIVRRTPLSVLAGCSRDGGQVRAWLTELDAPSELVGFCHALFANDDVGSDVRHGSYGDWQLLGGPISWHSTDAVLILVADPATPLVVCTTALESCLDICDRLSKVAHASVERYRLDDLVTDIATVLTGVSGHQLQTVLDSTLETICRMLGIDTCFLRRNDLEQRASILIAEWPRRQHVPDPDPLRTVPFDSDDPVFSSLETLAAPVLITPSSAQNRYQERIQVAIGGPAVSLAMVPLRPSDVTEGVLGFIHFGERAWTDAEIRALRVIAGLLAQVLARVDAEDRLHTLAYRDVLTGLPNRRVFLEEIANRLATTSTQPFTLLVVDLDRLKTTNDTFGHTAGDALITASAQRLSTACGKTDLVARLDGDEFVLILDSVTTAEAACHAATTILGDLRVPLMIGAQPIQRSASIGAVTSWQGASVHELMRSADMALLEAKSHGGDEVVIFDDILDQRTRRRGDLELRLGGAIDDGEFELFYQPEFDLRTRRITGVEALIRWNHPERGLLSADEFIPVAEQTNRIRRLGRWVTWQACTQLANWAHLSRENPIRMAVNVSPGEFLAVDFVDDLRAAIGATGIQPRSLCLEITESSVIRDIRTVVSTLHELRTLGVELAIDDFGTGHSSLAQLKDLPVDVLKIDRSFAMGIETDPSERAIVTGILGLAQSFNLDTVVEGVETEAAARILVDLGCIRAQGYLMAPAVSAASMTELLHNDRTLSHRSKLLTSRKHP